MKGNENKEKIKILSKEELVAIERAYPRGLTSRQIIEIFTSHGIALAEPTFRRYVQLGLLPRSRRVGVKGKHKGSKGIYPVETVRKINKIKELVSGALTLEQMQRGFARFDVEIDTLLGSIESFLSEMRRELGSRKVDEKKLKRILQSIDTAKNNAVLLATALKKIGNEISNIPIEWKEANFEE